MDAPLLTPYDPPQEPLTILHEDHEVVVVDKPAGLLSVPGKGPELADCLIERVRRVFPTVLLVHRLDRDTSGVIAFALTPLAQRHLGWQFEKRSTKKAYVARLWGEVAEADGTVDGGGIASFEITATDDGPVRIDVLGGGRDPTLTVLDDDGEQLAFNDDTDGLDASEPWAQLERDDFRTTIGWTKVGERELVLTLDQEGEVEVPKDSEPVDRDNSEDIPLD